MHSKIFASLVILFSMSIILLLPVNGSSSLQLKIQKGLGSILGLPKSNRLFNAERYRLPKTVIPTQYDLNIRPILEENDDFLNAPGFVRIQINCVEETSAISLHAVDIEINKDDVQVRSMETEESIPVVDLSFDLETESFTIHLENRLSAGKTYFIEISFMAKVASDRLVGLYLSQYIEPSTGDPRYLAATQFQDLYARMAFPCFDEPALKANFSIRVGRQESFKSLSNTIITETLPIDNLPGWVWDIYHPTEKMSTYLVAIIVSDFESEVAPAPLYDKPVAVWAPPHLIQSGAAVFAAQSSAKALSFFDDYLGFKYSFPKMDSTSVPDFNFGAMENWGLNIYSPGFLLYIEGESTQYERYFISAIVAHELNHQWFGNLVTMDWWNGIWLNEGLSTYFMFLGSAASEPQFNAMDRFVNDAVQLAMNFDEGPNTVPTQSNTTDEMVHFPRDVIYERGASLVRMMEGFLTAETLQKGLQNYLKEKAYGSVIQDEMFHELTEQAHLDNTLPLNITVKEIMDPWTLQPAFPILRVNKLGSSRISLSQERFYYFPLLDSTVPQNLMWRIPVSYVTKSTPSITSESLKPKLWIERNSLIISHAIQTDEWVFVNPDAMNYYRVLYDSHYESLLQEQLLSSHTILTSSSRSQLLDDYFKAAFARYISINRALEFTKYLEKEVSLSVWTTVSNNLREMYQILMDTNLIGPFSEYLSSKVISPLMTIGLEQIPDESPVTTSLRAVLLDWCCSMEHEICILHAESLFQQWITNPNINPIGVDIQPMLYCAAALSGNEIVTEFIMEKYTSAVSPRQKNLLLNALACTKREDKLIRYIEMAIDPNSEIPVIDSALLINSIAQNSFGRILAFDFILTKHQEMINYSGLSSFTNVINTLSKYFATDELLLQMKEFKSDIEHLLDDEAKLSFDASIRNIETNIIWKEVHYNEIENWFQSDI